MSESDLDGRLRAISATLVEFANLRLDARAPVSERGDDVDAVAAGVNLLGEELAAAFAEVEQRISQRTADLEGALEELRRRSQEDQLTGLPNRRLLWERIDHRLATAQRRHQPFAVLFCDLDHFKEVNDRFGHPVGDVLLTEVGRRLRDRLRGGDTAARLGGDEFVLLLDEVDGAPSALATARRVRDAVAAPYLIDGNHLQIDVSIGVALGDARWRRVEDLVAAADRAMYEAKRAGPGGCALHADLGGA